MTRASRDHGVLVVGRIVSEASNDLILAGYWLEWARQAEVPSRATRRLLKPIGANLAEMTAAGFLGPPVSSEPAIHFAALLRLLDGEDPSYAPV